MLRNNSIQSSYYYTDQHMYFSFDGVHSSTYNLFIINDNNLTIENNVSESAEFISAKHQEGNYYMGMDKTQKTFKRKCAAEGLTLSQYKRMMKWLNAGRTGMLVFDSNIYWGWNAVLAEVGDANIFPNGDTIIVEFELTWKTIGRYFARNAFPAFEEICPNKIDDYNGSTCNGYKNSSMEGNEYGIPVIYYEWDSNRPTSNAFYIQGINNECQFIDYTGGGYLYYNEILNIQWKKDIYVDLGTKSIPDVTNNDDSFIIDYLGESNLILADDELIELHDKSIMDHNYQTNGILQLPSETPIELYNVTVNKTENNYCIKLPIGQVNDLLLNEYNYICFTRKKNSTISYSDSAWNSENYPVQYETYLFFIGDSLSSEVSTANTAIDTHAYYNYMFGSIWTESNSALPYAYVECDRSSLQSSSAVVILNGVDFDNGGSSNDILRQLYYNIQNGSVYNCYMGKSNIVNIDRGSYTNELNYQLINNKNIKIQDNGEILSVEFDTGYGSWVGTSLGTLDQFAPGIKTGDKIYLYTSSDTIPNGIIKSYGNTVIPLNTETVVTENMFNDVLYLGTNLMKSFKVYNLQITKIPNVSWAPYQKQPSSEHIVVYSYNNL